MSFEKAVRFVLREEGGLSNNPADAGGLTNFGIASHVYPDVDIANLTQEAATKLYHRDYWKALKCDRMPGPVAFMVFDTAVNCGPSAAGKMLQRAMNNKGSVLRVDGGIGPKTLTAIKEHHVYHIVQGIAAFRLEHYSKIVKRRRSQLVFLRGWINRVTRLLKHV